MTGGYESLEKASHAFPLLGLDLLACLLVLAAAIVIFTRSAGGNQTGGWRHVLWASGLASLVITAANVAYGLALLAHDYGNDVLKHVRFLPGLVAHLCAAVLGIVAGVVAGRGGGTEEE